MAFAPEQYTRNPATVTAVLLTAENAEEVASWCSGEVVENEDAATPNGIDIWSSGGEVFAEVGDWVIQNGAFFLPCKPALFDQDYSPVA